MTHGLVPEFHLNKAHLSVQPRKYSYFSAGMWRYEAGGRVLTNILCPRWTMSHTRRVTCHVSRVTQARRFTAQDPSQLHDIYSTQFIFMVTSEQTVRSRKSRLTTHFENRYTKGHELMLPCHPYPSKIMITMSPGWLSYVCTYLAVD